MIADGCDGDGVTAEDAGTGDGGRGGCPLLARNLHVQMSAMPTDEPAQDQPPSIDTQQLQQQLQQQQDVGLGAQSISQTGQQEASRKRMYRTRITGLGP